MKKFFNNIFNTKTIAELKYEQILNYYEFHKKIESYYNEGYNIEANFESQFFYFIDSNWIKSWKRYINYQEVIKNLEHGYDFLINNNILNNDDDFNFNFPYVNNGRIEDIFLNKLLYKIEDFDCLINNELYSSFIDYYKTKFDNSSAIEGIFYDKMLVLIISKQRRIKIIYKGQLENNFETIQLNIDFPKLKTYNDNLKELYNIIIGKNEDCFYNFKSEYFNNENCEKIMNLLLEKNIGLLSDVDISKDGKKFCHISNNNLYKKYKRYLPEKINFSKILLKKPRFIGLKNIGATCYMNAIIQSLVNVKQLTKYLLNNDNFFFIIDNADECEILSCYCLLLEKLCCDEKVEDSYSPYNFKEIISRKNPLFDGVNANDSKDLLYFLFEEMNYEFNQINLKVKDIISYNNINLKMNHNNQSNKNLMLKKFINEYSFKNNNIIPKLFFSIIEIETICQSCNNYNYNYQIVYSLEFDLEKIYNKIYGEENIHPNKKLLSLDECFLNYNETYHYNSEDGLYCNICKSKTESIYSSRIFSLPPILIILLNRDKDNKFKCDVDFPENINIRQYIQCPQSNYNYSLIGIVSHLGSSGMTGHFISYCKHLITNEWYCYNDEIVSRCDEQLNKRKGTPYILIYESTQENKNILFDEDFPNNENNIKYQYQINFNNNLINNFNSMNINGNKNFNNNMEMINNMNNIRMNNSMNNINNNSNNYMNQFMKYNILNSNDKKNNMNNSLNHLYITNVNSNNMNNNYMNINNMYNNMNNNNINNDDMTNNNMNNNRMNNNMNYNNMNNICMNNNMNNNNMNYNNINYNKINYNNMNYNNINNNINNNNINNNLNKSMNQLMINNMNNNNINNNMNKLIINNINNNNMNNNINANIINKSN